jgi:hypothetical protein
MKITINVRTDTTPKYRILHNPEVPVDPPRPDVVYTADYKDNISFVPMTEAIQWLCFDLFSWGVGSALSETEKKKKYPVLYGQNTAFTNTAGFGGDPPRRDYINDLDAGAELPILQKGILCAGAIVTGRADGSYFYPAALSPSNVPTLQWLIDHPEFYFEAVNVNSKGQSRFPQGNGAPVYVPYFVRDGVTPRLPLAMVERV